MNWFVLIVVSCANNFFIVIVEFLLHVKFGIHFSGIKGVKSFYDRIALKDFALGFQHSQLHSHEIWAASWQNQQNGMYAQRRLRSAWASTQSDQSLRCPLDESLGP